MKYKKFLKSLSPKDAIVYYNYDLAPHTSFKIGGKAKYFVVVKNEKTLKNLLSKCKKFFILGGGTNTLLSFKYYSGTVIKLGGNFSRLYVGKNKLTAMAGANLFSLCKLAKDSSLSGLEFLYGIPGTVGGAIFGNAGAFEEEILSRVTRVKVFKGGNFFWTKNFSFSHRNSSFKKDGSIILGAQFSLSPGDKKEIEEKMKDLLARRKQTQPYGAFCAGSIFKRLEVGDQTIFPAKIIDNLGLKGVKIGGAKVSEKHAGFIVNFEKASATDVLRLIKKIKKIVYKTNNLKLEEEIIIFGGKRLDFNRRFPHSHTLQPRKGNNFRKCDFGKEKGP